jgi:hypothetical protein
MEVVTRSIRPTIPPTCPPDFRNMIEQCWAQIPYHRPTFATILEQLVSFQSQLSTWPRQSIPHEPCNQTNL